MDDLFNINESNELRLIIDNYNKTWRKMAQALGWEDYYHKNYDGTTILKKLKDE